jgi:hypothetical protein
MSKLCDPHWYLVSAGVRVPGTDEISPLADAPTMFPKGRDDDMASDRRVNF